MKRMNSMMALLAVLVMMLAASCSKDNSVAPASTTVTSTTPEVDMKQPAPGNYKIAKFIDTGDDETAQFNGYVFTFSANGALKVTTGSGQVFNGSWSLNGAETIMTINIAGNNALDDLDDDDWQVIKITNKNIKITKNGPDSVFFTRIP
jgi:hypothetical protein